MHVHGDPYGGHRWDVNVDCHQVMTAKPRQRRPNLPDEQVAGSHGPSDELGIGKTRQHVNRPLDRETPSWRPEESRLFGDFARIEPVDYLALSPYIQDRFVRGLVSQDLTSVSSSYSCSGAVS